MREVNNHCVRGATATAIYPFGVTSPVAAMSTPEAIKRWARATWKPFTAFAVAMVALGFASDVHNRAIVLVLVVVLIACASWLSQVVRKERSASDYPVGRARLLVSLAHVVIGIVAMGVSGKGPVPEAVGFAGLGFVIVAIGALMSELRRSQMGEQVRGPVILGSAFAVVAAALILFPPNRWFALVLLLGLVLAEVGTELHSEDNLRRLPRWNPWVVAAAGLGVLIVAGGLLVAGGAGGVSAAIIVVVVLALVWMAASDSDSLLLVIVAAGALVWAVAPREAAPNPDRAPVDGKPYFLVLGDSYMSGEGAKSFFKGTNTTQSIPDHTNECRRAETAWSVLLANAPPANVPDRMLFLACSGALTEHIRAVPWLDEKTGDQRGPAELLQYQAKREELHLTQPPKFVLLSVGGNDAGFGTIGQDCVGPGDCAELGDTFLDDLRGVEPALDRSYHDIRAVVGPDVPVIVVGYPIPITETGDCSSVLLAENERKFVVRFVGELNQVVRSAASRAGFLYMDTVETALVEAQNRLCEGFAPSGLNFLGWNPKEGSLWDSLNPSNWVHNSLHPNEIGHEAIYEAATTWFEAHPNLASPPPSGAAAQQVPTMAGLFAFGDTKLCDPDGATSCDVLHDGWLRENALELLRAAFLPLLLAAIGAWMIVIALIRWATVNNVSTATVFLRVVHGLWGEEQRPRP